MDWRPRGLQVLPQPEAALPQRLAANPRADINRDVEWFPRVESPRERMLRLNAQSPVMRLPESVWRRFYEDLHETRRIADDGSFAVCSYFPSLNSKCRECSLGKLARDLCAHELKHGEILVSFANKRIGDYRTANRLAHNAPSWLAEFGLNVFTCSDKFTNFHASKLPVSSVYSVVRR
jgi:hypothetical protein